MLECPSHDEDYEDACEEAHKSGRPLPEKKERTSTVTSTALSHEDPAKNFEKKERGNQVHWELMYAMFVGKIIPVNQI